MRSQTTRCPVTILTGFLGSGKTTLLANVLREPALHNTAVLVNEFGKVGLDHHLLRQVNEHTRLLGSGCACCTRREELVHALLEVLTLDERGDIPRLERVVIETSGLADPAPIHFTILTDPVLHHHFFIDHILTTVDAINGQFHLDCHPESSKQVALADTLILTKTDLASPHTVAALTARLSTLNPFAPLLQAAGGHIESALLFGRSDRESSARNPHRDQHAHVLRAVDDPSVEEKQHVTDTHAMALICHEPLDWRAFGLWLSMLLHARGEDVLRVKGIVNVGEPGPVVIHGVQHSIHPPEHLASWPDEDRSSRIVFITRHIQPQALLTSFRTFQQALGEGGMVEIQVQM